MAAIQFNEFHDETARKRLLDIAEARTTQPDIIADILKTSVGEDIDTISRIVRGESNEVYGIHTKQHKDVILRIGHWSKETFEREAWAIERAASVGVPAPTVLAVGEHAASETPAYYCVQEKLRGTTLDTLLYTNKLPADRAQAIVEKAGEALGKVQSLETSGWGYLTQPTKGELGTVQEKYDAVEKDAERIAAALKATKVAVPSMDDILARLKTGVGVYEGHQRLAHGDFGPKHIFVDEHDTITGIIDWEQAASSDPVAEFANWTFWFEERSPLAWLRAGHDRVAAIGDNYDERFRIAKLENAIWTLMYFTYNSAVEDIAARAAQTIADSVVS